MSVVLTSFTTVDYPGVTPPGGTALLGISNPGDAVGFYTLSGTEHGFRRSSAGALATIDFPGSSSSSADGINSLSQPVVVGGYATATGRHSFFYSGGAFTSFDVPGDTPGTSPDARLAINDSGQVVGGYVDASTSHGFLRGVTGSITVIDVPGASGTKAFGINNAGAIVGSYTDSTGTHGFLRDPAGNFTTVDVPGFRFTEPHAINNAGEIAGGFFDGTTRHGFFRETAGVVSTIDAPGATITDILGLNDTREIAGSYFDSAGNLHAFVGTLTPAAFWGVDTLDVVTQAFFDAVKAQAGVPPAFWGRYIGRRGTLRSDEVMLLHKNNSKVLVIFRDTSSGQLISKAQATQQAKSAIKAAQTLRIPSGVWIYADTEFPTQSPTAEWFAGWFETLQGSSYGAGVYGNTSTGAVPKFGKAFCDAYPHFPNPAKAYVYTNQPEPGCNFKYRNFSPAILQCKPPTVIQQYAIECPVTNIKRNVDLDLANATGVASMW